MPNIALVPWLGTGSREDPFIPQGLRPGMDIIDMRTPGEAGGWALASIGDGLPIPPDALLLGRGWTATVTPQTKARLAQELRSDLPGTSSVDSLIVALMFTPPPGRWNRVQADGRGMLRVHLGEWSFHMPEVLAAFRTEGFDKADSETVGPSLTWTETLGNWQVVGSELTGTTNDSNDWIRAEDVLDSDNHWCDVHWRVSNGAAGTCAPLVRYQAAANTFYFFELSHNRQVYWMGRLNGGAWTYWRYGLATPSAVASLSLPVVVRTRADGSSISGYVDMHHVYTQTDTSIPSGRRVGIFMHDSGGVARVSEVRTADLRGEPKISRLSENFSTAPLSGSKWQWTNLPAPSEVSGGRLRVEQATNYPGVGALRHDLTESFVSVFVKPPSNIVNSPRQDNFLLREQGNENELGMVHRGDRLNCHLKVGGREDKTTVAYDPVQHAWRRMRHSGTTVYFDVSPNGKDWSSVASKALTDWVPGNLQLVLQAGDATGSSSGVMVEFDNVNAAPLVYASDQDWSQLSADTGTTKKDRSSNGNVLTVRGTTYAKGLGTRNSDLSVPVPLGAQAFRAVIGQDDEAIGGSSDGQVFEVWNADKTTRLYQSSLLTTSSGAVTISIPVGGHATLRLVTTAGPGGSTTWDHADWADARFTATDSLTLTAEVALSGVLTKNLSGRLLTGALQPSGLLSTTKAIARAFSGSLTPSGFLAATPVKTLAGSLAPEGAILRQPWLVRTATVGPVGTLDHFLHKYLGGTLQPVGSAMVLFLSRAYGRSGIVAMTVRAAGEVRIRLRRAN